MKDESNDYHVPPSASEGPGGAGGARQQREQDKPAATPKTKPPEMWPGGGKQAEEGKHAERRKSPGRRITDHMEHRNIYGLASISQSKYPQAYAPVSATFWEGLSEEQRNNVLHLQAVAMEKAGFEKSAPKYFIENFDPAAPSSQPMSRSQADVDLVSIAAPRLILGGILIGAGAMAGALAIAIEALPLAPVGISALIAVAIGCTLALNARS